MLYETGRRRRGALLGGTATDQTNPSNKRRRAVPREDDGDPVAGRTPRRDRVGDSANPRSRNGARSRRFVNRPTEVPLPAYTNKLTLSLFYLPKQTRPCAFAYRIPPLPLRRLPPAGHLRTRRSSASPKFTQSSSQASFPSHSSIRNSRAPRERWGVGSSISSAGALVSGGRSSVVGRGVRVRIRVDSVCERTPSACFAIRICSCR